MRIIQLLSTINYGDAVSNNALALHALLCRKGYHAEIFAAAYGKNIPVGTVKPVEKLQVQSEDVLIYHFCIGHILNRQFAGYRCRRILIYHNVTPPKFYRGINSAWEQSCLEGIRDIHFLADKIEYCLAASEFNKTDLLKIGFQCRIDVLPPVTPFEDYDKEKDREIVNKYSDGKTNILFVGRIAPNKKFEDIIEAFAYYKKYFDVEARLFLVGNYTGMECYYEKLKQYVDFLKVQDVYFTGHIKFEEILAYYGVADVFLCASEHEGFCVPLVEAMYLQVPIIAYDSCAVGNTLGSGGLLLQEKKPLETAALIKKVVTDSDLKKSILNGASEQLKKFQTKKIEEQFLEYMQYILDGREKHDNAGGR